MLPPHRGITTLEIYIVSFVCFCGCLFGSTCVLESPTHKYFKWFCDGYKYNTTEVKKNIHKKNPKKKFGFNYVNNSLYETFDINCFV